MVDHRLTPTPVCVSACILLALPIVLGACAGHTAGPARGGDVVKPEPTAPVAAPAIPAGVIPTNARALPNGMVFDAQLNQPITALTPEGYAFSTKVAQQIAAKDGSVAVPPGAVLRGVITGIRPGNATTRPVVCLNLDFLELNGRSYAIRSSVKDVFVNDKPATILSRDSVPELFPKEAAGPPPGTPVVLANAQTGGGSMELPAGTTLVIELDSAIAIQR